MAYDKNLITAIILKNEHDACTPEELAVLEQWYYSLDDKAQMQKFENSDKSEKKDALWAAINEQIEEKEPEGAGVVEFKPGRSLLYYIARIAAIFILVAGSYFTFNWYNNKSLDASVDTIKYLSQINTSNKPIKIILPDNTLLWLDAKSSIKYADNFAKNRSVSMLAGKVFFNVAHDPSKPFIVETDNGLQTTVLGTAFVLEKGAIYGSVKVSVLRGKVQVADNTNKYATLTKNQAVDVNTIAKIANLLKVDSLEMTGWFNSKVVLDNVTLNEVANSIKETFGYEIQFSSAKLSRKPCSITYNATDNLDDILLLLDKIYNTKHIFTDSVIYIKPAR